MKGGILDRVVAATREHRSVALATDLVTGRQLLLEPAPAEAAGGAVDGDLVLDEVGRAAVREVWRGGRNRTIEVAGARIFVEVLTPPMRCFVVGAVHIAQPLAQMLAMVDYAVTVIDPRGAFATEARFPGVDLVNDWPDEALERLKPDRASAIVALTHDPKVDDPALVAALRSEAFYVGVLGSRRNHARRCERLKDMGFSDADLSRIHGPIGLAIGAVSPAEVAASIVAEMIQVLRQGRAAEAA
jgi:xanthine dehydrogenase accessory factor